MKILLLETIHDEAVELLKTIGNVHQIQSLDPDHVKEQFIDAAAVLTRGRGRIPREALLAGRALKCVARCGAGTDNIDVATATELGLPVLFSPDGTTFSVAEHTMMLMMAVGRKLTLLDREVKKGNWEFRNRAGIGLELFGKTLGIVGFGRIGQRTAELAQAFGMKVIYWSARSRDDNYQFIELEELFQQADVISISLALTESTRGLVNKRLISLMKPTAILVNTARGEVLDEPALAAALAEKYIAGAGLDVMASEPPSADHPLFKLDNIVITPHLGTITDVAYRKMCVEVAEQVGRVLKGKPPDARSVRNPQVL
jgi:D-3-phosphoglycerate dehydrogenase